MRQIEISDQELRSRLLPLLRGRVFHVTTPEGYQGIEEVGAVLASPPGATTWPYDAYFRGVGCVSLCDLRSVDDRQLDMALGAYFFLDPRHGKPDPVFLVLSTSAVANVVPYEDAVADGGSVCGKMLVPHIEAGYPGELPLSSIAETIFVTVRRSPPDPHLEEVMRHGKPT